MLSDQKFVWYFANLNISWNIVQDMGCWTGTGTDVEAITYIDCMDNTAIFF